MPRASKAWRSIGARRLGLGVGALALLAVATYAVWGASSGLVPHVPGLERSVDEVEQLILSWGAWGIAGSIMLMVLHSFVPFPAEIVAMANGMLFGPWWGTVITWSGAMLGAYLAFGLSRRLGRPFVLKMVARRHHEAIDRWSERQGGGALFFSRFMPVISFNLINYAAGLTSISWWTFTWATGLGILPLTFLMVLAGHEMWTGDTEIWLWLFGIGLVGFLIWQLLFVRRSRRLSRRLGDPRSQTPPGE